MHRFYIPPEDSRGETLTLTDREAHHAARVLRLKPGDRVTVLDGVGTEFLCDVRDVRRASVELGVAGRKRIPAHACQITLLQAIPKGKIIEDIIEKATELGVSRIVPVLSERVATRLDAAGCAEKQEKWRWVAIEAIKQCGAAWLPQVDAPASVPEFLERGEPFELPLLAALQGERQSVRQSFEKFRAERGRLPASVCVWVGPEGDFTPAEVAAIRRAGAQPITLGRLVLRCETAALFCLAVFNHELQAGDDGPV